MTIKKLLVGLLILFLILAVVLGVSIGAAGYLASQGWSFDERVKVQLPPAIGGTINVDVSGSAQLDLEHDELRSQATFVLHRRALNTILPIETYSILEANVEAEHIESLLGRVGLVPDSVNISLADNRVTVMALFEGEFFVRQPVAAGTEEQPSRGVRVPISGDIIAQISDPQLTEDWQLQFSDASARLVLDAATVRALDNRFGARDEFVVMLESLLNTRLGAQVDRFVKDGQDLRSPLQNLIDAEAEKHEHEWWHENVLRKLEVDDIQADRCIRLENDSLYLTVSGRLLYDEENDSVPVLPSLQLREENCASAQ